MKYNFTKYKIPENKSNTYEGLSLSRDGILFASKIKKILLENEYARGIIYTDPEAKALQIEFLKITEMQPDAVTLQYGRVMRVGQLKNVMPIGRYYFKSRKDNKFVFAQKKGRSL